MRKVLIVFVIFILAGTVAIAASESVAKKSDFALMASKTTDIIKVTEFGAKSNDDLDDSASFQKALDKAKTTTSKTVLVQPGKFRLDAPITIPEGVTLKGYYNTPKAAGGLSIQVFYGKDKANAEALITLKAGSKLQGITLYYPEQTMVDNFIPYSYTIRAKGKNVTVKDVFIYNPYQMMDFGSYDCSDFTIDGVYGQPISIGLYIDRCKGTGLVKDVHFWPFTNNSDPIMERTRETLTGFLLGEANKVRINSSFIIVSKYGIRFKDSGNGAGSYIMNMTGSDVGPKAIYIENVDEKDGVTFLEAQINSGIDIAATNKGPVSFTSCNLWGDESNFSIMSASKGKVSLTNCSFSLWGRKIPGTPALILNGGSMELNGCDFIDTGKKQIKVSSSATKLTIRNSILRGGKSIDCPDASKLEIIDCGTK